jgi:hypothetical protein
LIVDLQTVVPDLGSCIKRIDSRRPQASSARKPEKTYQPGIGPHSETKAVDLMVAELRELKPLVYGESLHTNVSYIGGSRQKCDLCIGNGSQWEWALEIKMLRLMGDNGKPNDNMLMHILSPYSGDRSALTDCRKLLGSGLGRRKAIIIYGFDYPGLDMDPAIEAFEILAQRQVRLGSKVVTGYDNLVHPVHQRGRIFGWEVLGDAA